MCPAYLLGEDGFIITNFVLVPTISGLRVPCLRVPALGSRVPGPRVSVPDFRLCPYK